MEELMHVAVKITSELLALKPNNFGAHCIYRAPSGVPWAVSLNYVTMSVDGSRANEGVDEGRHFFLNCISVVRENHKVRE